MAATRGQTYPTCEIELYSKQPRRECHSLRHVALRPRFQANMSNWVSSLIQHQDGCLQMVAQQATQGRLRQEQLAHTVAQRAAMPSQNDQVSYLRVQLAHREAQLEQVRAERDNPFIQEEVLAHTRLLSSEYLPCAANHCHESTSHLLTFPQHADCLLLNAHNSCLV